MRLGLVCPYDLSKPGGVQAQVKGLAKALITRGDKVIVFGPGLPDDIAGVDLGRSVSIPGNGSMVPLSADPRVRAKLRKGAIGLDLLHVHEPLMPVVSLMALRVGPPVVATFHAAPERVGSTVYRFIGPYLHRILGANTRRITAVSKSAARHLPSDMDVRIVPNGVDVASYDSTGQRVAGRVVFLGRDEPRKGLDLLLEAWERVRAGVPQAELVVMGADRGHEGIVWMGVVDDGTKTAILGSAEICVAPNTGGESFGIVLVEGMAAGAAVVASGLDSFRDVAGDAARFFTPGDAAALASTLIDVLTDQVQRRGLSFAGPQRAAQFDWANVASRYRSVYEEALS